MGFDCIICHEREIWARESKKPGVCWDCDLKYYGIDNRDPTHNYGLYIIQENNHLKYVTNGYITREDNINEIDKNI